MVDLPEPRILYSYIGYLKLDDKTIRKMSFGDGKRVYNLLFGIPVKKEGAKTEYCNTQIAVWNEELHNKIDWWASSQEFNKFRVILSKPFEQKIFQGKSGESFSWNSNAILIEPVVYKARDGGSSQSQSNNSYANMIDDDIPF